MDASAANSLTDQHLVSDRDHAAAVTFFNSMCFDSSVRYGNPAARGAVPPNIPVRYHGTLACAAPWNTTMLRGYSCVYVTMLRGYSSPPPPLGERSMVATLAGYSTPHML